MVTSYHSNVTKGLILAGKELIKAKKIKHVYRGEEKPLSIVDYDSKLVVNYKPDVYFILRNNKKFIFEVLDSEEEKQDIIIADVIRSFLVENVEAINFVFSGDEGVELRIIESLVTISKGLIYKGMPEKEIPFGKSGTIPISKNIKSEKVKEIILKELF